MELSVFLSLVLLTGLFLLLVRGRPKARGNLPPGPRPLPFLGNLLQMDTGGLLSSFLRLREKYGDVFTVYLGPRPVVMLCGTEAIREALVDQAEDFSGRGKISIIEPIFQEYGVIFSNGERWKTLRRFSLATMRDFGMGKRSIEKRIQEEAQCLVEELRKSKGALLDPTFLFQSITANIICSIVFGERFDYQDGQFLRLLDMFYQSFALMSSFFGQVFELFSDVLKHFPGTHRQVYKNLQEVITFIGHSVEKHRATLDPSNPRDFIDTYLLRMDKEKSNPHSEFHHKNLIITLLSLFFAGTETTSTTLRYGFLLMLKYPHVAERVKEEIAQVIGSHRPPALDDHSKMPYTEAVIHEIQRFGDLLPIGVPHIVTRDTLFRGYLIPKVRPAGLHVCSPWASWIHLTPRLNLLWVSQQGPLFSFLFVALVYLFFMGPGMAMSFDPSTFPQNTEVYPILSSALHDPHYFEKPDAFNPDRFLDANGALKKNDAFIPFSAGKRICLGEGIARNELFLFFTTILQNFSVASPVAPEDIDLTPRESGVGRVPPTYQIRFLPH